jgi:hypothetical protein
LLLVVDDYKEKPGPTVLLSQDPPASLTLPFAHKQALSRSRERARRDGWARSPAGACGAQADNQLG